MSRSSLKAKNSPPALWPVLLVLSGAFIVKSAYLFQSQKSPFFEPLLLDPEYYHNWAIQILSGNPGGVFYGLPLYPFFIAFIYKLFGLSVLAVKWAQILLGTAAVYFIYRAGLKLFDSKTAFLGMVFAAVYGPVFFHESIFIPEALGVPLYALSFWGCCVLYERPGLKLAFLTGVCLGLAALTKAGVILFVVFYSLYFIFRNHSRIKNKTVFFCLLGFAMTLAPVTAHNWFRGQDFVLLTSHSGFNFYVGNHPGAEGVFSAPQGTGSNVEGQREDSKSIAERTLGRVLKPSEVSKFWSSKAWDYILNHPGDFLVLCAKKLALFFDAREISDVQNYEFAKNYAGLLRFPWLDFSWLGPLFFLGLVYGFRKIRHGALLGLWVGGYLLGMMAFFVNARYRLPILPVLFPVAAYGVLEGVENLKQRQWRVLGLGLVTLLFGFGLGNLKLVETDYSRDFVNAGDAYMEMNQVPTAAQYYERAMEVNPEYAKAHLGLALAYTRLADHEKARQAYQKTLELDAANSQAWNNLGLWYDRAGDLDQAEKHFLKAIELKPGSSQAYNNLGMVYGKRHETAKAIEQFEKSLSLNPGSAKAHSNLALMLYQKGDSNRARELWQKALELDPDHPEAKKALKLLQK